MDFKSNLTLLSKCKKTKLGYENELLTKDNRYLNHFGFREGYNLKTIIDILSKSYTKAILNYEINIWFNDNVYHNNNKNNIYLSYYKTIELENLIYSSLKALLCLCGSDIYTSADSLLLLDLYTKYYNLYIVLYNYKHNQSSDSSSDDNSSNSSEDAVSSETIPTATIDTHYIEFLPKTSPEPPIPTISLEILNETEEEVVYVKPPDNNDSKKTFCDKLYAIFKSLKTTIHSTYKNVICYFSGIIKKRRE